MLLHMELGEIIIDAVSVEPGRCKEVGYLEAMKQCLLLKHLDTLANSASKPQFYIQVSSRMNDNNFRAE